MIEDLEIEMDDGTCRGIVVQMQFLDADGSRDMAVLQRSDTEQTAGSLTRQN